MCCLGKKMQWAPSTPFLGTQEHGVHKSMESFKIHQNSIRHTFSMAQNSVNSCHTLALPCPYSTRIQIPACSKYLYKKVPDCPGSHENQTARMYRKRKSLLKVFQSPPIFTRHAAKLLLDSLWLLLSPPLWANAVQHRWARTQSESTNIRKGNLESNSLPVRPRKENNPTLQHVCNC